jgi:hypothetical protein
MQRYLPLFALFFTACLIPDSLILKVIDRDLDGELALGYVGDLGEGTDCDDLDPDVGPHMPEVCHDSVDNDCDGEVDEDSPEAPVWYFDGDADGYGTPERFRQACVQPAEFVSSPLDCDDRQSLAFPGAVERCNGIDDDCNGEVDEAGDPVSWYTDRDGDGFGDPARFVIQCDRPSGHVQSATDCDDSNAGAHPGAVERWYDGVDADCLGGDDYDQDGDLARHPSAWAGPAPWDAVVDCDDTNPRIYPNAPEFWYDGVDQDCDPSTEWDRDADGVTAPGAPFGSADDCDDTQSALGPPTLWYVDADGDGFGDPSSVQPNCGPLVGRVAIGGDCDDSDDAVSPVEREACDGVDNDCRGGVDDGVGPAFWPDVDGDGVGDARGVAVQACTQPPGYSPLPGDCDDLNPLRSPWRSEGCDGIDNDCDDLVDEGVQTAYYPDVDGDTYGDAAAAPWLGCTAPGPGWYANSADCDDSNRFIRPGAIEGCDAVDNNCDGAVDEGVQTEYHRDGDGDGVPRLPDPDPEADEVRYACSAPAGFAEQQEHEDCDDTNPRIYPGQDEAQFPTLAAVLAAGLPASAWLCDGLDNDCNPGTLADPPAGCGEEEEVLRFDTPDDPARSDEPRSRYMRYLTLALNADDAETWCAERGYHLWWLDGGGWNLDSTEHAMVMSALGNVPSGTRIHLGYRSQCPSALTYCPLASNPSQCVPESQRLLRHDPGLDRNGDGVRDSTCANPRNPFPPLAGGPLLDHRVVHEVAVAFGVPNRELAPSYYFADVLCEREVQ